MSISLIGFRRSVFLPPVAIVPLGAVTYMALGLFTWNATVSPLLFFSAVVPEPMLDYPPG